MVLLLLSLATATTLTGQALSLSWNDRGTLNDPAVGAGLQALHEGEWVEWLYAGTAWQIWSVEYTADGEPRGLFASSAGGTTAFVLDSEEIDADGRLGMRWTYATPELSIVKTETFAEAGSAVTVTFQVANHSDREVELFRLLYGMDPDPEFVATGGYETAMDVRDLDGDGLPDYTEAVAPTLGYALGVGGCVLGELELGGWSDWQSSVDPDGTLVDGDGALADAALGALWWPDASLAPGRSVATTLVFALGDTADGAALTLFTELETACCDVDGDGEAATACGGLDCDDADPTVLPGAEDPPYDGVDADCAGDDDLDRDGDGEAGAAGGGLDCDDADPAVHSGSVEVWYDGADQNCDGNDDDQDQDGYTLASDCDDTDEAYFEDCPEPAADTGAVNAGSCGCAAQAAAPPAGLLLPILLGLIGRRRTTPAT